VSNCPRTLRRRGNSRRSGVVVVAVVAVVVAALAGCTDDGAAPAAVEVRDAWVRPTPAGTSTGAVYLTLRAGSDDELLGVGVDPSVAASATPHETVSSDGVMAMEHAAGVQLPADDDVEFEPGGLHLMVEGLRAPLVAGDSFELTLDFDVAPDLVVIVDVREDRP
jgi:copper(I)-binding protein